ncbi:MAG: efflux RND transporter periplasmic adaptor subunit [Candidatus Peregrinibacteria bacterium]|nr:efflux RND transporter periplasmic adaptor subunit [Candidatus Peregrinibacteria bacterium]
MFEYLKTNKKKSVFLGIVILIVIYYVFFKKAAVTANTYTLGTVEKGTIVNSVSGSGQVVVSSQVEFKPQASGKIVSVNVKDGDKISAGTVIAEIDSVDAQRAVRDAKLNLESSQIALDKILKPAENLTVSQAQDAVSKAQRDLDQAKKDRNQQDLTNTQAQTTAYNNGYSAVSTAFLDVPDAVENLKRVQSTSDFSGDDHMADYGLILGPDSKFVTKFKDDYSKVYTLYNSTSASVKAVGRSADPKLQYKLIKDTLEMTKVVAENLEDARALLDAVKAYDYSLYTIAPTVDAMKPKILLDIAAVNKDVTTMQTALDTIDNADQNNPINKQKKEDAVTLAEETLKEKQDALAKVNEPADELDVRSQKLTVEQRQNALNDAEEKYNDYFITSPFDAVVAKVSVSIGDQVSSGTTAATLITNEMQAQISLNEVDAANIKVGDKATMVFDALPELTITGKVYQIDTLGTVSQGVVTYNAKIVFDTADERVKPGMSVSADIITNVKTDILVVPNSAIKSQGGISYVETLDPSLLTADDTQAGKVTLVTVPNQANIEIGISNDTQTEITSGLKEGDQIITQTISGTASSSAQSAASSVRIPGLSTGGGGNRSGAARGG